MSLLNGSSPRRMPPPENDIEAGPATRHSSDFDATSLVKNTATVHARPYWPWTLAGDVEHFYSQIDEVINGSQRTEADQSESGISENEIDPSESEVTGIITVPIDTSRADINEKFNRILSEGYYVNWLKIMTPMGNTVLHIAAWYGNDDVVDVVAEEAPNLLFQFNNNGDTPLHVAARGGNIHMVEKLLDTYANFQSQGIAEAWKEYKKRISKGETVGDCEIKMRDIKELVSEKNIAQGNTMLHEALLCGKLARVIAAFEPYKTEGWELSLAESCYEFALVVANHAKKSVLYLAVEAGDKEAVKLILDKADDVPKGPLSPIVAAIMKQNEGMLQIILERKPRWIHLTDKHERLPLHYAASTGFLEGVVLLLDKCWRKCCGDRKDKYGYFPLHLASQGGHVDVVEKLLNYCPNATEMLDSYKRNILHIAAKSGKHEVVLYIRQTTTKDQYYEMINQRDSRGDTPLHLATRSCHPKTVHCLTWDPRVDLGAINEKKQTALDIANALYQHNNQNASMRLQLVWIALKSAGVKQSSSTVLPIESRPSYSKLDEKSPDEKLPEKKLPEKKLSNDKVGNNDSDRVETLSIVSTLIITASVAACLAVPGEADGRAHNLYHAMFQVFIICITVSLFSSISATIILFWARLGLIELLAYSLKIIMPLLGVALISLSLAFLAGIYTIISELSWLATLFLVMAGIFVVVEFLLYILLFLPSSSTNKLLRYMSYYPFLFLASLAESRSNQGTSFNLQGFLGRASKK